jgi:hypothetical protein
MIKQRRSLDDWSSGDRRSRQDTTRVLHRVRLISINLNWCVLISPCDHSVSSRNDIKGGQIIILLNFLVKITNIAYFWPFKGGIVPPIPPLAETDRHLCF